MPKRATPVVLSDAERAALERMVTRHRSEQQQALRARIVLAAAAGHCNIRIARDLAINVDTARLWRDRWVSTDGKALSIAGRLRDAPRPGAPARITVEQRCQIAALACEAPMQAGRPISQWTGREIADEIKARGIVERISSRHAAYLLKKGGCNRTASATG